jgi:hypothetical protein
MSVDAPYGFYSGDEFLALPRDPETWLVKPLVPVGGFVNIYGQPKKARKSYLALGLAWAVASGQSKWLGFEVKHSGPVLYLQADTPHNLWTQRVEDIAAGGYDFSNVWFASLLTIPYPFNIAEHEDTLAEMISVVPGEPVMIIFDTGAAMHTLDENKQQDMTLFMHALSRVAGHQAKVLITHSKKAGGESNVEGNASDNHEAEGGDLMRGNRGSGAVAGGVDTIIKVTPKGYLYYQGRAVGEQHKKMKFSHVHGEMGFMWEEDIDSEAVEARALLDQFKNGSERSLARLLAKSRGMDEAKARAIIRKQKKRGSGEAE